jgi:hypothetical protein
LWEGDGFSELDRHEAIEADRQPEASVRRTNSLQRIINTGANATDEKVISSSGLDGEGRFDLGIVPVGEFRLVAFWVDEGKIRRLPLFDQPGASNKLRRERMSFEDRAGDPWHGSKI